MSTDRNEITMDYKRIHKINYPTTTGLKERYISMPVYSIFYNENI
jgi:hypothetical protein